MYALMNQVLSPNACRSLAMSTRAVLMIETSIVARKMQENSLEMSALCILIYLERIGRHTRRLCSITSIPSDMSEQGVGLSHDRTTHCSRSQMAWYLLLQRTSSRPLACHFPRTSGLRTSLPAVSNLKQSMVDPGYRCYIRRCAVDF